MAHQKFAGRGMKLEHPPRVLQKGVYTLKLLQEDEEFHLKYIKSPLALQNDLHFGDDGDGDVQ